MRRLVFVLLALHHILGGASAPTNRYSGGIIGALDEISDRIAGKIRRLCRKLITFIKGLHLMRLPGNLQIILGIHLSKILHARAAYTNTQVFLQ